MSFYQMQGLLQRATTAILFATTMLVGIFAHRYTYLALFLVITFLCLRELFEMTLPNESRTDHLRKYYGFLMGLAPFLTTAYWQLQQPDTNIILALILGNLLLVFCAFLLELYSRSEHPFEHLADLLLGWFYIGIPFALLNFIAIHDDQFWPWTIFAIIGINWGNDTMAYLVGSRIGKTPLFPRISPKKTWEGMAGGFLFSLALAWVAVRLPVSEFNLQEWLILAFVIAVTGSLGDLVESMLKRSKHIKDSGKVLPGHGGLLDRFDALIFLIPFVMTCIILMR